jgi:pyruvate,water dikinase
MSVVPLAQAGPECGGKAHALAALLRAGFPVPDGFVVTGPAGAAAIAEHLPPGPVAVRSSGPGEDSATASFAGQLETVLGARSLDEVLAAIERCAAGTGRARDYRHHLGLAEEATIPVLVQELVPADRAGVLFTVDPRTGAEAVVINASWGLGESVVSGRVTPDEIVVTPGATRIAAGAKQTRLDLREGGLVRTPVPESGCCLSPTEIQRLAALGRRCHAHFGRPQDVEWAIAGDRIWVLQSRPVTAVAAPRVTGGPGSPGRARGPARLVRSVDEFARLRRGDVLVCRSTDPAWTPLFRVAAAVVTETGGVLSHAAIVAREFGIPAVVGAGGAMTTLADGTAVIVDGIAGTVTEEGA